MSTSAFMSFPKGCASASASPQSLINDPKILFYDEPTSGLDAIARRDIRDLMLQLKAQGKTMFLSSHQLEDVEAVCNRVSIIHKGHFRTLGTVDDLLAGEHVEMTAGNVNADLAQKLQQAVPSTKSSAENAMISETHARQPDVPALSTSSVTTAGAFCRCSQAAHPRRFVRGNRGRAYCQGEDGRRDTRFNGNGAASGIRWRRAAFRTQADV